MPLHALKTHSTISAKECLHLNLLSRLHDWLGYFRYTPKGRERYGQCGAIIVVGGDPWQMAQRGVEANEGGTNTAAFTCRYYLAVNEKLPSNTGEPIARALSDDWSRDITLRGETLIGFVPDPGPPPENNVLDFQIGVACVLENDTDTFQGGTPVGSHGTILLDEATESQERAGWRTLDMRLSSDPNMNV